MDTRHAARVASVTALTIVPALSPYTRAAAASTGKIGNPVPDTVQLWTTVIDSIETAAQQLAAVLELRQPLAATSHESAELNLLSTDEPTLGWRTYSNDQ